MDNSFQDYQNKSRDTYKTIDCDSDLTYPTLGMVNEAGEFAGKLKKVFRDHGGIITEAKRDELKGELGDILWYFTQICTNLGLSIEEVAEHNLAKLKSRKERGVIGGSGDNR